MAAARVAARRLQNPAIFLCDIQEKFRNVIYGFDELILTSRKVLRAAAILDIPVYVTTQNRARLGDTVHELAELLSRPSSAPSAAAEATAAVPKLATAVIDADKTLFSMYTPEVKAVLEKPSSSVPSGSGSSSGASSKRSVVIFGLESHICVTQTTLDLLAAGHAVYVLADGVSSCNPQEVPIALARLQAAGATVTTSESWLYEYIGDASIPEFRSIVALVKDTSADTKKALSGLLPSKI